MFVRFKDSNGKWSLCSIRNFYKELLSNDINILPYITRGEYFIDTDPGFGNGNDIQVNASNNITDLNFTIDLPP